MLLQAIVAVFQFTNGNQIVIVRDTVNAATPVYVQVTQGIRKADIRLGPGMAYVWATTALNLATLGSTPLHPDSLDLRVGHALGFTTKVACGKASCSATIFNIQLWGSTYTYLRPGPLPIGEVLKAAQALFFAERGTTDTLLGRAPPRWPYFWKQP